MADRVGIVAAAQTDGATSGEKFYDQAFWVSKTCLEKAGLCRCSL